MSPEFAVVVCAHDMRRWDQLGDAVASLRRQTLEPAEIVVVVDHNSALLERAAQGLEGVIVVANTRSKGLSGARNTGIEVARATHVAFLDDDAAASERWLERLSEPYADPDVAGVGGMTRPVWDGGRPRWFPPEFDWVVGGAYRGMERTERDVRNMWGGNMSLRRDLVVALGGFRIGPYCDDTELCIRLRQRWPEKRVVVVPNAEVEHFVGRSRTTVRSFLSRCYVEGATKAVISRAVGGGDGLASEREYTRRVLPKGLKTSVGDAVLRRDPAGLARAALIIGGLTSALTGYLIARAVPLVAAKKRGWMGEEGVGLRVDEPAG